MITIGYRHQAREKIFAAAVIDDVEVKKVAELSPRDIEHDNPEFRRRAETVDFLETVHKSRVGDGQHRRGDPLLSGRRRAERAGEEGDERAEAVPRN